MTREEAAKKWKPTLYCRSPSTLATERREISHCLNTEQKQKLPLRLCTFSPHQSGAQND